MWVNIFSSAPLSALVPVLMILFGFGETTIVAAVFLFAVWIIVLDTRAGVRHIAPSLIEMARSYGASRAGALRQDHPVGGAARDPGRHPARADPRRQGRRHRPAAGLDRRLWRAVRDLLAQLPHDPVLGAHDHPVRLCAADCRADRARRGKSRLLRRSERMNLQNAAPATSSSRAAIAALPVAGIEQAVPGAPHLLRRAQLRRACRRDGPRPQQGAALLLPEEPRQHRAIDGDFPYPVRLQRRASRDRDGGGAEERRHRHPGRTRRSTASSATASAST